MLQCLRTLVLLPGILLACCGSTLQGPILGNVEVSRVSDAGDVVVLLRCSGPGIHGDISTDREHTRVAANGRYRILFSLQFPTTERCYLNVLHPRYRTGRVELGDEFVQNVPTVVLEDWPSFFANGPTYEIHPGSHRPWPETEVHQHLSDTMLWLRTFPEAQRGQFVEYVPDIHALFRLTLNEADLPDWPHPAYRDMLKSIGRLEKETGYSYPFSDLLTAAKTGDSRRVRELIDGGVLLEVWDTSRYTPLRLAAGEGHVDVVNQLLALVPASAKSLANVGCGSPLLAALNGRHWHTALALLRAGASPVSACSNHRRVGDALGEFARRGETRWLQQFLEAGVPVDVLSQRGTTALAEAVVVGRIESVKALLAGGANPDVETMEGVPVLDAAIAEGYLDVEMALRRAGADA
jgi:hypothetical protein